MTQQELKELLKLPGRPYHLCSWCAKVFLNSSKEEIGRIVSDPKTVDASHGICDECLEKEIAKLD